MKFIASRFQYDKQNDILYYTEADKSNSYGEEEPDNIVFMRDIDTDDITGITVFNFATMYKMRDDRMTVLAAFFNVATVIKKFDILGTEGEISI